MSTTDPHVTLCYSYTKVLWCQCNVVANNALKKLCVQSKAEVHLMSILVVIRRALSCNCTLGICQSTWREISSLKNSCSLYNVWATCLYFLSPLEVVIDSFLQVYVFRSILLRRVFTLSTKMRNYVFSQFQPPVKL